MNLKDVLRRKIIMINSLVRPGLDLCNLTQSLFGEILKLFNLRLAQNMFRVDAALSHAYEVHSHEFKQA